MRVFYIQQCSLSLCSKEASECCRYIGPSSLCEKKRHGLVVLGRGTRSVPLSRQVSGSWRAFLHTQPPRLRQVLPGAPLFPLCFHGDGLCILGSSVLTPNKARHCSAHLSPNWSEYRFSPAPDKGISKQASKYLSPEDLSHLLQVTLLPLLFSASGADAGHELHRLGSEPRDSVTHFSLGTWCSPSGR